MSWLDEVPLEAGSYYVMDCGYLDLQRLQRFNREGAFFVIRERPDISFYVAGSRPVDRATTLRCDQTIRFNGEASRHTWPLPMRRVGIGMNQPAEAPRSLVQASLKRPTGAGGRKHRVPKIAAVDDVIPRVGKLET